VKLHWSPRSPFVRKVMVVAHERDLVAKLDCVRTMVAITAPNQTLRPDNPLNKIPTLVLDEGTVLYDSPVICEYLDGLGPAIRLIPLSGPERLEALRRQALGDGFLDFLLLWRNERSDRPEQYRSPDHLKAFQTKYEWTLGALDKEADALAAGPLRIGHVAIACALSYLDFRFADLDWRTPHPRIAKWHKTFADRPSMKATIPYEG
jgi:glutathione S-transferase